MPALYGYGLAKSVILLSADFKALARAEVAGGIGGIAATLCGAVLAGAWGAIVGYVIAALVRNLAVTVTARTVLRRTPVCNFVSDARDPAAKDKGKDTSQLQSFLGAGLTSLYQSIDIIILSLLGTPAAVAVYRIAKTLARLGGDVFEPFWKAARPEWLARLYDHDRQGLLRLTIRVMAPMLAVAVLSVTATLHLAPWFLGYAYGPGFASAATPLAVLILGQASVQVLAGWAPFWVIAGGRFGRRNLILLALCLSAGLPATLVGTANPCCSPSAMPPHRRSMP
ncbi:lipopolysaccharide biosynthesis protein [Tistrella bauzanensis]